MKIAKSVVQIVVLHPADESPLGMRLSDIEHQIDEGSWLGQKSTDVQDIFEDPERIRKECQELGNDGDFFEEMV